MVLLHCWCFACNARLVFIQHQEGEHVWCILFLSFLGCLFRLLYADAAHLSCWHRAPHTKGASEGTIRGIVAGTHPSALYERYKSEGAARFKNSISTGPFKDEEEQVGTSARAITEHARRLDFSFVPTALPSPSHHHAPDLINSYSDGSTTNPTNQTRSFSSAAL